MVAYIGEKDGVKNPGRMTTGTVLVLSCSFVDCMLAVVVLSIRSILLIFFLLHLLLSDHHHHHVGLSRLDLTFTWNNVVGADTITTMTIPLFLYVCHLPKVLWKYGFVFYSQYLNICAITRLESRVWAGATAMALLAERYRQGKSEMRMASFMPHYTVK